MKKIGLKTSSQFDEMKKKGLLPEGIPNAPDSVYSKNKEWKGWGDFFGTGNLNPEDKSKLYLSYKESKKIIKKFKFKSGKEFLKSKKIPKNIPISPQTVYKRRGEWKGWGDFLDMPIRKFLSFENAKKIARKNNIKNRIEYEIFSKNKQYLLPSKPSRNYPKQWKGWPDFLGKKTN